MAMGGFFLLRLLRSLATKLLAFFRGVRVSFG
jgi:hypothetical protein